jgi:hypothetical protein
MVDSTPNSGKSTQNGQAPPHMAANGAGAKPEAVNTRTTEGIGDLWLPPGLSDGVTSAHLHVVPIGKPKGFFFRVHPGPEFRRSCEIYVHKVREQIGEEYFFVAKPMRGEIEEARPCTLLVCIDREGSPQLWPVILPRDGERDNVAWISARRAARVAMDRWVKLVWTGRAFTTHDAKPGFAPEPDWKKLALPTLDELVTIAAGEHGIIRNHNHPIVRELVGAPPEDDGLDDADVASVAGEAEDLK